MYQEGLHLQFKTFVRRQRRTNCNFKWSNNLSGEVKSLLEKNVKQPVRRQGFYSTFFLVPKKDGRFGPTEPQSSEYLPTWRYAPFQNGDIRKGSVVQAMFLRDCALSLGLKNAYLHKAICPAHRWFLRFVGRSSITKSRQWYSGWP